MCIYETLTFDEIVKVVKHLIFWGLGKLIYPIQPKSVIRLTANAGSISS
jgi:hypothetical protein